MNAVQQNIISEMQTIAKELITIQMRLTSIAAMYGNESIGALTDADFATYGPFAHILASEFQGAAGAMVAVNTALGSGAGSNWAKLLKIVDGVPR